MTSESDLLRAICDEPDDNDVRLVYADWLEDHDRLPRAEFIRVQIARAGRDADDPDVADIVRRENELAQRHEVAWRAILPVLPRGLKWGEFRRGFVDGVVANWGPELLTNASVILETIPLRRLELRTWRAGHSLTGSALLAQTRELYFSPDGYYPLRNADHLALGELLTWPERGEMTHLTLNSLSISGELLARLAEADLPRLIAFRDDMGLLPGRNFPPLTAANWLGQLATFELKGHPLSADRFCDLCGQLNGEFLRRLTVNCAGLTDDEAIFLARSGLLANLETLDLGANRIGPTGLRELLDGLPTTARLLIGGNPLGEEGLHLLADSPLLLRLTQFPTQRFQTEASIRTLARSPHARNIRSASLVDQSISAQTAEVLFTAVPLEALTWLFLRGNPIGVVPACRREALECLDLCGTALDDAGLSAFCTGSHLPRLRDLNLARNRLAEQTTRSLSFGSGFPALVHLDLSSNPLGDAGAIALFEEPGLVALESLKVTDCGIGDAALCAWSESLRLHRLKTLELESDGNPITHDAYFAFCEAAYQFGCDVDRWSQRPRLRPIRRPADGSPLPAEERAVLVAWIQHLWFAEYHTMGWLKATTLADLRKRELFQLILHRYETMPTDDATRRAVIGVFLSEWLTETIPESIGIWNTDPQELEEISRPEALELVGRIVEASLRDGEEATGLPPRFVIGPDAPAPEVVVTGEEPRDTIPYSQIVAWFTDDLLDPNAVVYFTSSAQAAPVVIALDRDVIAIFWLE